MRCGAVHWARYCCSYLGQIATTDCSNTRGHLRSRINQRSDVREPVAGAAPLLSGPWLASNRIRRCRHQRCEGPAPSPRPAHDRREAQKAGCRRVLEVRSVRRSLAHLITAIQTLTDAGVGFTSIGEGIDTRSATGRLMLGILGSFAEFERERIRERIHAGMARARREGKRLGRRPHRVTADDLTRTAHLSQHEAAKLIGVPRSVLQRARAARNGVC